MSDRTSVLIMSGERGYRDMLRWSLAEVVDDVVIAASWSRVVPLVQQHHPDLVVLDFDAIDHHGRDVLMKMLTTRYHLIVIAIGTKSTIEDAESLGAVTAFRKPLNIGVLMSHVERLVGARQDALAPNAVRR